MRMKNLRRMTAPLIVAVGLIAGAAGSAAADVPFEFLPGQQTFTQTGAGANVAGGHPDLKVSFELRSDPPGGSGRLAQAPRTATVDLPPGLVGNPRAASAVCPMEEVAANEIPETSGRCPHGAAVGVADLNVTYPSGTAALPQRRRLFRIVPGPNEVAAFATTILSTPVRIAASVSPSGGYRVRVAGVSLPQSAFLRRLDITFWGVPADRQGPAQGWGNPAADCDAIVVGGDRYCNSEFSSPDDPDGLPGVRFGGPLPGAPRRALVTNPSVCGADLTMGLRLVPYGTIFSPIETTMSAGTVSGCENQPFDPSIDVTPPTKAAGQPSGYTVGIDVPQSSDADDLGTAHVKDVSVTLPEGVAISPPSANGLDACSDAQLDLNGDGAPRCPDASKIGSLKIETPVLEDPIKGSAYLGTQLSKDPMSGEMYRLFLVAKAPGVLVKLKGAIKANPTTGQLTTTFENNPQLPFSRMELALHQGNRASLANPKTCGAYTAKATLTSYAGHSKDLTSSFVIDEGCPDGRFAPTMRAGTANPLAGAFSPFSMTLSRTDADQDLSRLNLEMPSGLLAALGSVPLCGEAEANAGTCGESSRVGTATVAAGPGPMPFWTGGRVYITGPYNGHPYGLSIVARVVAGPFDLGTVVVRAAIEVNKETAAVRVIADPMPSILEGVPLRIKTVNVAIDKPGFMLNPTNCDERRIDAAIRSVQGTVANVFSRFQVGGCGALEFDPELAMSVGTVKRTVAGATATSAAARTPSEMMDGGHPALTARVSMGSGRANNSAASVTLPRALALEPENANGLCEPADAAQGRCPAASIVGSVTAVTPLLNGTVDGPVYFVRGERKDPKSGRIRKTLPRLYVPLTSSVNPQLKIDLHASSDVRDERLVTTFENLPDVPITTFDLHINGGKNGILVVSNTNACASTQYADSVFTGQNNKRYISRLGLSTACPLSVLKSSHSASALNLRLGGIAPGKVTITGKGLRKKSKTIPIARPQIEGKTGSSTTVTVSATTHTSVAVPMSRSVRRALSRGRNVKVKVSVGFKARGASKTTKITKTLVIHGKKKK